MRISLRRIMRTTLGIVMVVRVKGKTINHGLALKQSTWSNQAKMSSTDVLSKPWLMKTLFS